MTTAHTATPIKAHKAQGSLLTHEVFDANGDPFAQIKAPAEKVEFIVRACNAHDDLVVVAKVAKDAIAGLLDTDTDGLPTDQALHLARCAVGDLNVALAKAGAA